MPSTCHTEKPVKKKMKEYLRYLTSTYPAEKTSVVKSRKNIRKRCAMHDRIMVENVIGMMESEGLASVFSGGKNPNYEIDLKKTRSYLADNPIGSE